MASSSSPSSTPRKKKTLITKPTSLTRRAVTVFKKASELSTLCGIDVCVIYYDSNGELKTWPKDRNKVKDMALKYMSLNEINRSKKRVDLREFLNKFNKDDSSSKKLKLGTNQKYQAWDSRFDNYSVEQLEQVIQSLEVNLTRIQHRLNYVLDSKKQRNSFEQEQSVSIASAMNLHRNRLLLQQQQPQHSNNVSMYLFNQENGTFSRIPTSTTSFNQAQQSLPPMPQTIYPNQGLLGLQESGLDELMKPNMFTYNNNFNDYSTQAYQNFKVEDYSGYLGLQGTGTGQFQNPNNVFGYNSFNNMNMGNYPGLLGTQGNLINGFQNMNIQAYGESSNTNTNGFSNQFVPFQTQTSGQGFQFGSVRSQY
ncbi:unnamed protein product [Cochlearia groenlandica]